MASTAHSSTQQWPSWRAYAALAFGIICIAWSAIWVKIAAVPGPSSAFYRMAIAAVALPLIWVVPTKKAPTISSRKAVLLAALGGLFFAGDVVLWNTAILKSTPTTATLFANNAPLWVGLGAMIFFRERLPRGFWIGTLLTLLGVALVLGGDFLLHPHLGVGDLMALGAGVFYAAYLLTTQRARETLSTRTFMTISTLSSTVLLLVFALVVGAPLTGYSPTAWWALVGLGLGSHLGGWLAINYALGHIPASIASVSLLGQPVLTAVFSWMMFRDLLTWYQFVGGALVLLGVWWVNQRRA